MFSGGIEREFVKKGLIGFADEYLNTFVSKNPEEFPQREIFGLVFLHRFAVPQNDFGSHYEVLISFWRHCKKECWSLVPGFH